MKKILSLVLVIILLLALFSACTPSGTDTSSNKDTGGSTDSTETNTQASNNEEKDNTINLENESSFLIHQNYGYYEEISAEGLENLEIEEGKHIRIFTTKEDLSASIDGTDDVDASIFENYCVALVTVKITVSNGYDWDYIGFYNFRIVQWQPIIDIDYYFNSEMATEAEEIIETAWLLKIPRSYYLNKTTKLTLNGHDLTEHYFDEILVKNVQLGKNTAWLVENNDEFEAIKEQNNMDCRTFWEESWKNRYFIIYMEKTISNAIVYRDFSVKDDKAVITILTRGEAEISDEPSMICVYIMDYDCLYDYADELEISILVEEIIK